jgi:hypothetical protein
VAFEATLMPNATKFYFHYRLARRMELPVFKTGHDWRFELELIDL